MLAPLPLFNIYFFRRVVSAFDNYSKVTKEAVRFVSLVQSLQDPDETYKAKCLFLFNTLIAAHPDGLSGRMAMRQELLNLRLFELIDEHCPFEKKALRVQVTVLEEKMSR